MSQDAAAWTDEEARAIVGLQSGNDRLAAQLLWLRESLMKSALPKAVKSLCEWRYKHLLTHASALFRTLSPDAVRAGRQLGLIEEAVTDAGEGG
jgi:hypothetical protein